LEVARSSGRLDLIAFIEKNLRRYGQHQPSRTPWPAPPPLVQRKP
jgi:hypothetical protein